MLTFHKPKITNLCAATATPQGWVVCLHSRWQPWGWTPGSTTTIVQEHIKKKQLTTYEFPLFFPFNGEAKPLPTFGLNHRFLESGGFASWIYFHDSTAPQHEQQTQFLTPDGSRSTDIEERWEFEPKYDFIVLTIQSLGRIYGLDNDIVCDMMKTLGKMGEKDLAIVKDLGKNTQEYRIITLAEKIQNSWISLFDNMTILAATENQIVILDNPLAK